MVVFDREGRFLGSWGEGTFTRPHGVTITPDDTVYCTDDHFPASLTYSGPQPVTRAQARFTAFPLDTFVRRAGYSPGRGARAEAGDGLAVAVPAGSRRSPWSGHHASPKSIVLITGTKTERRLAARERTMATYPFNAKKLETLMEEAKVDLLLATTRHNIRYLTGGRYHHFFLRTTRQGASQYLSAVGLPRGRFQDAFYVGRRQEQRELAHRPLWISQVSLGVSASAGVAGLTVETVKKLGLQNATIGVEMPFLPADAFVAIQQGLPQARLVDATALLGELRAIKTPEEIGILREAHERVAEAIHATFRWGRDGVTTQELYDHIRVEVEQCGLDFLYCFATAGPSVLRAPSTVECPPR